jgi:hypothetical protein
MASFLYDGLFDRMLSGGINFFEDEFSVMLVAAGYWPERTDATRLDVTHEVTGSGYQLGGKAIAVNVELVDGVFTISLGGAVWPNASISARYALYFRNNSSPQADDLLACVDFGGDVTSSNAEFTLSPSRLKFSS